MDIDENVIDVRQTMIESSALNSLDLLNDNYNNYNEEVNKYNVNDRKKLVNSIFQYEMKEYLLMYILYIQSFFLYFLYYLFHLKK